MLKANHGGPPVDLDTIRLDLLTKILALAPEELPPVRLLLRAAWILGEALGPLRITYVDVGDGLPAVRYTTDPDMDVEATPVLPEAIRRLEQGPVVVEDVAVEPWLEPVRDLVLSLGVRSAVDIPVRRGGRVVAAFWFNCHEPRRWSPGEVQTLEEIAEQLNMMLRSAEGRERRRRAEADLRRRDVILDAVNRSAQRLLEATSWLDVAPEVLRLLGEAAGVSRAYVFENVPGDEQLPATVQRAEWSAEGWHSEADDPALGRFTPAPHFPRWAALLGAGDVVKSLTRDLPDDERVLIELLEAKSTLAVPITVSGEWWGFIGFDDCERERGWSAAEEETLRLAASVIAAAIARARSENVLREHEQKLRAVFETALDAIFIADDDGNYVDVNPAGCELLGVAHRDLIGRNVKDFLPEEEIADFSPYWERFREGQPTIEEWRSRRADGEVRIVQASARPGFLPGLNIAFLRDVTERKRLERDLLSAQKLESLGRLAGGVAHDFNNLLTAIGGYTTLLLERAQSEREHELEHDLRQIEHATDRAAELTRQLLAFGRRQLLQPVVVDANEVVERVGTLLSRVVGEQVDLVLSPAAATASVLADPGQLEQVVVNLAMNARDAMSEGGTLTIATRVVEHGDGRVVELAVTDTGAGIDDVTRERIFEPFFTTRENGVGLGLASVHGIVTQSGGHVTVSTEPGRGSTFLVTLPHTVDEIMSTPAAAPAAEARAGAETILLVEDEEVVRSLAQRVLERSGYTVLACPDGAAAIEVAERHEAPIDLLLTDVVMPGLRGPDVAERVSASRPDIKVLYMSGYADESLLGRAAAAGAEMIEKPFAVAELARRVRVLLEHDEPHGAAAA